MIEEALKEYFQNIEDNFNQAVVSNDVEEIKKCISEDWVLVDAQGGIIPREKFLYVVEQGLLSHSTMSKELLRVKIYDNIAVVTGRGKIRVGGRDNPCRQTNGSLTFIKRRMTDGSV